MLFNRNDEEADFARQREKMATEQLVARGIAHPRVLHAMRRVPRHLFVPKEYQEYAYADHPVQIGEGQTISQPYMVALMTQLLDPKPTERVLEIGTGSGYQTAILAELADHVWSVERRQALADAADARLRRLGYQNVTVVIGDGSLGYPQAMPYDAILVTAAGPEVPSALKAQLADEGRLICPAGPRESQKLTIIRRHQNEFAQEEGIGCVFVPLIGQEGWAEE